VKSYELIKNDSAALKILENTNTLQSANEDKAMKVSCMKARKTMSQCYGYVDKGRRLGEQLIARTNRN